MPVEVPVTTSLAPASDHMIQEVKQFVSMVLDFFACPESPSIELVGGILRASTPNGTKATRARYELRTRNIKVGLGNIAQEAQTMRGNPGRDHFTDLWQFCVAHEVTHFVQHRNGALPDPALYVGLFEGNDVASETAYDRLPHEYEANMVAMLATPGSGLRKPGINYADLQTYSGRSSAERGHGFAPTDNVLKFK